MDHENHHLTSENANKNKYIIVAVCLLSFAFFAASACESVENEEPAQSMAREVVSKKYCNVCKSGGQILNPDHAFKMEGEDKNGKHVSYDYTCGLLQEYVADVLETGGGSGDAIWCDIHQLWAKKGGCECSGVEPPAKDVHSANPKCNLCAGQQLNYVPEALAHELAPTGVAGEMACGGLYKAMALGVMTAEKCVITQKHAGPICCSIPVTGDHSTETEEEDDDPPSTECGRDGPSPGEGFVVTDKTGGIYAVYEESPSKYCHVIDPGELELIRTTQGWGKTEKWTSDELTCNREKIGFCPWPSGMLIRDNAIYFIKGATPTRKGTVCWVQSAEQIKNFGGFKRVWKPSFPSNQLKFEYGTSNGLKYGDKIPPCTNNGDPAR